MFRLLFLVLLLIPSASAFASDAILREYVVGPRDVLDIKVYDEADLSKEAVVGQDGTISYPLLGTVKVSGATTLQIERMLQASLGARFLVNPQVFVNVKEYNSRRAVVLGMVKNPGPYALTGDTTVLDLISRAGGVIESGGKTLILVRGGNRAFSTETTGAVPPLVIDAHKLLRLGDKELNVTIKDGDILFAPKADGVYVYGEVKKPGVVPYRDGLTVLQAVSLAEGLSGRANGGKVQVIRSVDGIERKFHVNLDKVVDDGKSDLQLKPEDIIVVPESFL
jgi:polysaccharide export outer membrane protein